MMNIQTSKTRNPKQQLARTSAWSETFMSVAKIVSIVIMVAVIVNSYIYLNQQIQSCERKMQKVQREISDKDREIERLKIRREGLTAWPHIRNQIAKYKLNLREAEPNQIQQLARLPKEQPHSAKLTMRKQP